MPKHIVVIGTSAGGTTLLPALFKQFTDQMDMTVLVVMHLSKHSIGELLTERLQKSTSYTCKIPEQGETLKTHYIYISKPDHHLMVKGNKILLGNGPMENRYRPSIDALFRSAAASHGSKVVGIILTGLLEDGAAGMLAIRRSGGVCVVQDPNEAQYPDMPRAVFNILKPDYSVQAAEMGEVLQKIFLKKRKSKPIPVDIIKEAAIAERVNIGINQLKELGTHSIFSCPDCGGGLWEIKENGNTRYRCHVGHAFTQDGLLSGMEASTESALWTALRIIEERRNLLQKITEKENTGGSPKVAASYLKRATELEIQIDHLKNVLFSLQRD